MTNLCTFSNNFFRKCKRIYDGRVVSMTKNEYGFVVHFFKAYELTTIYQSSPMFVAFMMKKLLVFSLTYFCTRGIIV